MIQFATSPVFIASAAEPVTIYYCKAGLPTGQTVRVSQGRKVESCRGVKLHNVSGSMIHGNSTGKAKASKARCVLKATSGAVTIIP